MKRAILVDDEALVRERVRSLLSRYRDFEIVAECADGEMAIEQIQSLRPDVAFLDIKLPRFNGFDIVANLESPLPMLVFVTAYDDFAVKAFDESAVDYLLKPIDPSRFEETIMRLRERKSGARTEVAEVLARDNDRLSRIAVRDGKYTRLIEAADVELIESDGNYVKVFVGNNCYRLRQPMKTLEARLDPDMFIRIHRSAIANLSRVTKFEPFPNAEFILHFQNGMTLVTSRAYARRLRKILSNL